jgi:hypothetical protein
MLTLLVPAILAAIAPVHTADAGGRLAAVLADASAIDWVAANDSTITFGIERGTAALRVTVTVRDDGDIGKLAVVPVDGVLPHKHGALSWLGGELRDATSIDNLSVDDDGVIIVSTTDGRKYKALPARKSAGNAAVEARWAAAWDTDAPE